MLDQEKSAASSQLFGERIVSRRKPMKFHNNRNRGKALGRRPAESASSTVNQSMLNRPKKPASTPNKPNAASPSGRVCIIDDNRVARALIERLLINEGYDLVQGESAVAAVQIFADAPPDVLILDVVMPGESGIELCARLKANPETSHIPILLISAINNRDTALHGLEAGADDFMTKPVYGPELRARVRNMLRMKHQYDALQSTMRLRDDLANMVMHDMRKPVAAALLHCDLLKLRGGLNDRDLDGVNLVREQMLRLRGFLNDMLLMAKMDSGRFLIQLSTFEVGELVSDIVREAVTSSEIAADCIQFEPSADCIVQADVNLTRRVIENLLSNAIKYSPANTLVTIQVEPTRKGEQAGVRVSVLDQGQGIADEEKARVFQRYHTLEQQVSKSQIGLGLAFCQMVVEAHGGVISVKDNEPKGSIFTFEF